MWTKWQDEKSARVIAELQLNGQMIITESVQGRLTVAEYERDSVVNLHEAAEAAHGELVAALRLRIAQRDTVVVHDTIPTMVLEDGTRIATFDDSTFAGRIEGTVTAPPYPAQIGIRYTLTRPEFTPEIGFMQLDTAFVALVSWRGENYRIESPYFRPPPRPDRLLGGFLEAAWHPVALVGEDSVEARVSARAGLLLRLPWRFKIQAGGDFWFESNDILPFVGVRWEFR
jgi:hypothetical protein